MSYQIFISYRRDGGEMLAMHLAHRLREKGLKVFFDMETMRSGKFNEQIFSVIDDCSDFLLILTEGSLDRCVSPSDWVRLEIEHALKANKNIIPVLGRNFEFPEILPESINEIRYCHGLHANTEFFDSVIEKIISLLKAEGISQIQKQHSGKNEKFLSLLEEDYKCLIEFRSALKFGDQQKFNSAIKAIQMAMQDTFHYYEREQFAYRNEAKSAKKIVDMFNEFTVWYNEFSNFPIHLRMSDEAQEKAKIAEKKFNSIVEFVVQLLS